MADNTKTKENLRDSVRGGAIVRFADDLIQRALESRASDIHIEPGQNNMRVRFRIDGILVDAGTYSTDLLQLLASRLKILANLDISQRRLPQDGWFQLNIGNTEVNLRLSTFPTIDGENIVLRVLDKNQVLVNLEEIGMGQNELVRFREMIHKLYGLVLVTGPNGSGKTTTLYAALNLLNSMEKDIATLEDPVEYRLPLVRQTQVDNEIGLTFSVGLRSLLRQDPDIIMVGESRDRDTIDISINAALTGHLVLSTLHTNNSVGALSRLVNMGIDPILIAEATLGVVAQRLVRKICLHCRAPYTPDKNILDDIGLPHDTKFHHGKGCDKCNGSGFLGRVGIFEVLKVDDTIKNLLIKKVPFDKIHEAACRNGMKTLPQSGLDKVLAGVTTLDEVVRVTEASRLYEISPDA